MYVIYVRCHMKRVRVNEDIRSMSEFRTGIASFLKQIHDTKRPMIITQHGKGVAVLLDAGEYEAMQERIELLQDIQTSIGQIETDQGVDHDQAKRTVLDRIRK
jgi:antitoxin YefM